MGNRGEISPYILGPPLYNSTYNLFLRSTAETAGEFPRLEGASLKTRILGKRETLGYHASGLRHHQPGRDTPTWEGYTPKLYKLPCIMEVGHHLRTNKSFRQGRRTTKGNNLAVETKCSQMTLTKCQMRLCVPFSHKHGFSRKLIKPGQCPSAQRPFGRLFQSGSTHVFTPRVNDLKWRTSSVGKHGL